MFGLELRQKKYSLLGLDDGLKCFIYFSLQTEGVKELLKDPLAALNCWWRLCQRFQILAAFLPRSPANRAGCVASLFSCFPLLGSQQGDNTCSNECVYHDKAEGGHTHRCLALSIKAVLQAHTQTDGRTHTVCRVLQRWSVSPQKRSDRDGMLEAFGGIPNTAVVFLFVHTSPFFPTK